MALDVSENNELYLTVIGSKILLTGYDFPSQSGHNDFENENIGAQGFCCWFLGLKLYFFWSFLISAPMCIIR